MKASQVFSSVMTPRWHEPVVLQRLLEVARGVRRHVAADLGDALAARPCAAGRFRPRPARAASSAWRSAKRIDGVAADMHGAAALPACRTASGSFRKSSAARRHCDVGLKVEHALAVDLVVQHGVAGRALLHELGEDAGLVGVLPFGGHLAEDQVAHRPAAPEGNDGLFVYMTRSGD